MGISNNSLAFNGVDVSGTITTGGTAQTLVARAPNGYSIYNLDVMQDLWVNDNGTAAVNTQGSLKIPAGGYFETPPGYSPSGAISIIGAVTGQKFTAKVW